MLGELTAEVPHKGRPVVLTKGTNGWAPAALSFTQAIHKLRAFAKWGPKEDPDRFASSKFRT